MNKNDNIIIPSSSIMVGRLSQEGVFAKSSGFANNFLTPNQINEIYITHKKASV